MNILLLISVVVSVSSMPLNDLQYLHNISLKYDGTNLQNLDSIDQLSDVPSDMAQSLKDAILTALPSYLQEVQKADKQSVSTGTVSPAVASTTAGSTSSTIASSTIASSHSTNEQTTIIPALHQYPSGSHTTSQGHESLAESVNTSQDHPVAQDNQVSHTGETTHDATEVSQTSHTTVHPNPSSSLPTPAPHVETSASTESPTGTTTDFWSRTDLVHFHVDIDMPDDATMIPLDGPLPH